MNKCVRIFSGALCLAIASTLDAQPTVPLPSYTNIGDHAGLFRCYHGTTVWPWSRCGGYPDEDFFVAANAGSLGTWLRKKTDADFKTPTHEIERVTEDGRGKIKMTVRAIDGVDRMELRKLQTRGMVVARIDADAESAGADKRYKIGGRYTEKMNLANTFYLVVKPYKLVVDPNGDTVSRQISTWQIFASDKTDGHLVALPNSTGKFRFCAYPHTGADRYHGSYFQSCKTQAKMALIEMKIPIRNALKGHRSLLATISAYRASHPLTGEPTIENLRTWFLRVGNKALPGLESLNASDAEDVVVALEDETLATLWVTCGTGCCTADGL